MLFFLPFVYSHAIPLGHVFHISLAISAIGFIGKE